MWNSNYHVTLSFIQGYYSSDKNIRGVFRALSDMQDGAFYKKS